MIKYGEIPLVIGIMMANKEIDFESSYDQIIDEKRLKDIIFKRYTSAYYLDRIPKRRRENPQRDPAT